MPYTKTKFDSASYRVSSCSFSGPFSVVEEGWQSCNGTFTGDYNPSWRSQVRKSENATTAASGTNVTIQSGFLDFYGLLLDKNNAANQFVDQVVGIPSLQGWRTQESPPSASLITDVTNRCIAKFLDSCDTARSSIEFGQDAGEWKETLHGIISPLKTLRKFILEHLTSVKKLAKVCKNKRALSKLAADSWLEFKFGWFPLAADVGRGYADLTNNRDHFNVAPVYGSAFQPFVTFDGPVTGFQTTAGNADCRLRVTGAYRVRMKGAIKTGAVNGKIPTSQMLQLDLPHFVPTIWDLLPYSWIADYFVNIGEIIRAVSFQEQNLTWGNKTIRLDYTYEYSWSWRFASPNQFFLVGDVNSTAINPIGRVVTFQRNNIFHSDLLPEIRVSLPLGSEKPWLNMLALLTSRQDSISSIVRNIRR